MEEKQISVGNLEKLLKAMVEGYQLAVSTNLDWDISYNMTLTYHKVPSFHIAASTDADLGNSSNIDVAYLRLTRSVKPKGGKEEEWEENLIYHQSYRFKSIKERIDPKAKWKFDLYMDLLMRLTSAGLEYSELLRRMKNIKDNPPQTVITPPKDIIVTDQMPTPIYPSVQDKDYKRWVDRNHDNNN